MTVLHTVAGSPARTPSLESCLRVAGPGSAVLLYEDAVYAALDGAPGASAVREALGHLAVFVLEPDLRARGVHGRALVEGVERVDYGGFVDLVVEHPVTRAWP